MHQTSGTQNSSARPETYLFFETTPTWHRALLRSIALALKHHRDFVNIASGPVFVSLLGVPTANYSSTIFSWEAKPLSMIVSTPRTSILVFGWCAAWLRRTVSKTWTACLFKFATHSSHCCKVQGGIRHPLLDYSNYRTHYDYGKELIHSSVLISRIPFAIISEMISE